jgi:hypothetical protein
LCDFTSVFADLSALKQFVYIHCSSCPLKPSLQSVTGDAITAMHTIEATPILLGALSGFVTGIVTGLGIALARVKRADLSLATLDQVLVALSLVAAFGLGIFVSFALW